jgi:hypothetical protein
MTDTKSELPPARPEEVTSTSTGSGRARWIIVGVLALGWLAGVLWRLWLGHRINHPIAHADENSYMNVARAIAGGPGGFSTETELFRRIGYPLIVSPAFAFGLDFTDGYRIVQIINAVISAATLPLAYVLGRRMFRLEQWPAVAVAFAAATLPAAVVWSLIGMTDSVLAPLLLGWLLAIHWWLGAPGRKLAAVTAGIMIGLLYLVHIRGTILGIIYLGLLVFMLVRRRSTVLTAALAALPLVLSVVLNQVVIELLGTKIHLLKDIVGDGTAQVLTDPHRLQVLIAAVGTNLWYLCVAGAGMAGIGWTVTALELWRPTRDAAFRWTAAVALISTLGVTGGAALILAGLEGEIADAIYSRYVQMFVPFWLVFGLAVLLGRLEWKQVLARAALPVLVLAAGGGLIAFRLWNASQHGKRLLYGFFGGPDIMTMTLGWQRFRPLVATAIGLGALVVILLATRTRKLWIPVLALIVVANGVTMAVMRSHTLNVLGAIHTPDLTITKLGVGPGDRVSFTTKLPNPVYYSTYHDVNWTEIEAVADVPPPGVNVVVARYYPGWVIDWDGTKYGFQRIAESTAQHYAIWRKP